MISCLFTLHLEKDIAEQIHFRFSFIFHKFDLLLKLKKFWEMNSSEKVAEKFENKTVSSETEAFN